MFEGYIALFTRARAETNLFIVLKIQVNSHEGRDCLGFRVHGHEFGRRISLYSREQQGMSAILDDAG